MQRGFLSPPQSVLALSPMSLVLRNVCHGYDYRNRERINHLLFMDDLKLISKNVNGLDSLTKAVHVFSSDIGMQFGMDECATIVIDGEKVITSDNITLPNKNITKSMNEKCLCKYLDALNPLKQGKRDERNIMKSV